ncbi:MAG: hypothetical protein Q9M18_00230, partial [Mariprofundaceae bacterium]|nr:hypothetical protein [Mariprofundaceae bacterium]
MLKLIGQSLLLMGLFMGQAEAASIEQIRQDIDHFKQQDLAEYAPMTLARAEAYLGAGMLAKDSHDKDKLEQALQRSEATLDEAKASATRFQQQFTSLLAQRARVEKILAILPSLSLEDEKTSPFFLMNDANFRFKKVIKAFELGQLNKSQNLSLDAIKAFQAVETSALPYLEDTIQRMLSKAAMKGAKRYAPVTYSKATAGLVALKAYLNQKPVGASKPKNLVQIYVWGKQAFSIASRVKAWRKDRGSYEMLVLQNQHSRQRLAEALQLNPDVDYSTQALVKAVHQLQTKLQQQSIDAKHRLLSSKQACKEDKKQALAQLQATLL